MNPIKLTIKTTSHNYPIIIGSKLTSNIGKIIKKNSIKFKSCLFVVDSKVPKQLVFKNSQTEIQNNMHSSLRGSELGLVGNWAFDENDGNINEEFVRINGTINVEAITKIWIVRRAGTYGMSGKFTCVDPPMISIDDF